MARPTNYPMHDEILLLPEEMAVSERFNVRLWPGDEADELHRVEELARTIERDGQLDSGIVIANSKEDGLAYTLFVGHRRRRAIALINSRRGPDHPEGLLRMRVRLDRDRDLSRVRRKATISNLHRRDYSPMELAALIVQLRQENNWDGSKGAHKVADYLTISVTNVLRYERLMTEADPKMQAMVHQRQISLSDALEILDVVPKQREEVLTRAAEIEAEMMSNVNVSKIRLSHRAVLTAIRESKKKPIRRNRTEILSFITDLDSPRYGYPDSDIRVFARLFLRWTQDTVSRRKLHAAFEKMTQKSSKGTRTEKEESYPSIKMKKGKLRRVDKGVIRTDIVNVSKSSSL